jgi:hypothetical protein
VSADWNNIDRAGNRHPRVPVCDTNTLNIPTITALTSCHLWCQAPRGFYAHGCDHEYD